MRKTYPLYIDEEEEPLIAPTLNFLPEADGEDDTDDEVTDGEDYDYYDDEEPLVAPTMNFGETDDDPVLPIRRPRAEYGTDAFIHNALALLRQTVPDDGDDEPLLPPTWHF
jgi:hypothetical protein